MQIKVENTKPHIIKGGSGGNVSHEILVVEAKLVLMKIGKRDTGINTDLRTAIYVDKTNYQPILISETEKILPEDWYYANKTLFRADSIFYHGNDPNGLGYPKILALPEHFSPHHLQLIVDGKLKDGDKVLIECEDKGEEDWMGDNESGHPFWNSEYFVKLDSSNHINISLQTEEDNNPYNLEVDKQYWFQYTGCKSNWFCGIVTRFTQFGHPWVESTDKSSHNGIISPGLYKVQHVSLRPPVEEKMYTEEDLLCAYNEGVLSGHKHTSGVANIDIEAIEKERQQWFKRIKNENKQRQGKIS